MDRRQIWFGMTHNLNRRTLLKGTGGIGPTLVFAGVASANGETRYLARVEGSGATGRIERAGYDIETELADGEVLVVVGPDGSLDKLEAVRGVQVVIPDFKIELEEPVETATVESSSDKPAFWDRQWDKHVTGVEKAHQIATGEGSTVAIIDTGIDHTHPDLQNVNGEASAAIFGGEIRDHTGDWYGHGTHVAGIAAATGEIGVVGTAPDAELVSLRVFTTEEEEQDNFWSDLLLAIEYAVAEVGADSANMSLGTIETLDGPFNAGGIRGVTEPIMQYATRQGTVVVGSAGNHGESLQEGGSWTLPNSLAGVISTSATGPNDELTFYSNWGTNEIDVGAPGGGYETLEKTLEMDSEEVEWPFPTNLVWSSMAPDSMLGQEFGQYAYLAGTSMAAPQVSGAAALLREEAPDANVRQVENAIKQGADIVTGQNDSDLGAGRLNVRDALDAL
ncbi:S8 family serine peptidase [Natrinema sp. 1APR25-10V2]|uniref:S8 family peptidase n=1 Tax=Natrinema sp. 1APR25-10V2 TaxID=2951081 RepID=UPI0028760DAB|nr:S8 family serine peptidase [Natrinema sp. 1APR25-10V2]MDS0473999.1 S8 family serine peptidase [Natrinema sp. 1APR25-10V2]